MKRYDLDVKAAAEYLGVTAWTVRQLVSRGQIAHFRISRRGPLRFAVEDLEDWKASRVVPARRQGSSAPPVAALPVPAERVFGDR